MMQPSPFPVNRENINICWTYLDALRRKSRLKAAISVIGGFFSNLTLLLCLIIAANALLWLRFEGTYHAFLNTLPGFPALMELLNSFILSPGDSAAVQALKLVGTTYAAAIGVFILIALVIRFLYHPLKKQLPEGTYPEQTTALATAAREARTYSYKTRLSTSIFAMIIAIVAAVVLLLAYIVYSGDAEKMIAMLSIFPTRDYPANCLLYVLAGYFLSGTVSWVMLVLTRWIYRYEFPYDLVVQAEAAAIVAPEDTESLSQEEQAAKRRESAAALREEALALELEHAYARAKALLLNAALCGDVPAMEHYARLCLLDHMNDSARYWLDRCMESGEATPEAQAMLKRMKLKLRHNVSHRRPPEAPLTKGQLAQQKLLQTLRVLWRIFILLLMVAAVAGLVVLFKNNFDIRVFADLSEALKILLN